MMPMWAGFLLVSASRLHSSHHGAVNQLGQVREHAFGAEAPE